MIKIVNRADNAPYSMKVYEETLHNAYAGKVGTHKVIIEDVKYRYLSVFFGLLRSIFRRPKTRKGVTHVVEQSLCMFLDRRARVNVITVHDLHAIETRSVASFKNLSTLLWPYFLARFDLIFCPSSVVTMKVRSLIDDKTKVITLQNCLHEFSQDEHEQRDYDVLLIGKDWYKNHIVHLTALAEVSCERHLDVAWLAPPEDYYSSALGLENICISGFHGLTRTEVDNLYRSSKVVLFCSLTEGFGYPVIESLSAGCSLVTSKAVAANFPGLAVIDQVRIVGNERDFLEVGFEIKALLSTFRPRKVSETFMKAYSPYEFANNLMSAYLHIDEVLARGEDDTWVG